MNNCGCEYDGGDCCDPDASTDRCGTGDELIDECKCKDPVACQKYPFLCGSSTPSGPPAGPPAGPCDGSCENDGYKNDGYCDDGNNNCGCDYDGGDCCGPDANKDYCDDCKCLDPNAGGNSPSPPGPPAGPCDGSCENEGYKKDGYCDDGNNNCGCDFDGGDCCDPNADKNYCTECKCKQ